MPGLGPGGRLVFRQRTGRSVVFLTFADPSGAEFLKDFVKLPTAETEGLGVGHVAECKHTISDRRQVGPIGFQGFEKGSRVVRHIALTICRRADDISRVRLEHLRGQIVHQHDLRIGAAVLQDFRDLAGNQFRRAGHRADEDFDLFAHAGWFGFRSALVVPIVQIPIRQYNAACERCKAE